MPVYKYRSLEEAEIHLRKLMPKDPLQLVSDLQDLVYTLTPPGHAQRGLFKFKDFEEANQHQERTTG